MTSTTATLQTIIEKIAKRLFRANAIVAKANTMDDNETYVDRAVSLQVRLEALASSWFDLTGRNAAVAGNLVIVRSHDHGCNYPILVIPLA